MNNWFSGSSDHGSERRRGVRASASGGPPPSFDQDFSEARVCLVDNFVYVDWADGGQFTLNMRHCDQVMLGESSRKPPRRLTLRFRRQGLLPAQDESDTGMVLLRVGLHDEYDLTAARDLYAHLLARFPWLDRPPVPETEPPAPLGEPEETASRHGAAAPGEFVPGFVPSGRPALPLAEAPDGEDIASTAAAGHRLLAEATGPGPALTPAADTDASGDWVSFAPGPRTRELYEEVLTRRREAEGR
ncbi:Uncharacterised protein [Nocardiopsis dassonvillei]|uniref:Uncharacterized protein n=1 Tax=Nocardiopsis dassonvillei (strain ATCC 23218 / DSM 43111 / CIP 107115 / JCM 7437 / KCTC 9190 / NBRC 14626 / NCTC 10488 / NRRL B-5397 / IMRU 509) TaxID=446468 RepID=D7AYY7_NOCDD|nr:hypothetical protein Ndas_2736 [Nocardiopsis dassonvillei subsp. dassonvillei DSM 43111]VEI88652.1 Uncharacterised protein [Nocardiopsis dassonvillei]